MSSLGADNQLASAVAFVAYLSGFAFGGFFLRGAPYAALRLSILIFLASTAAAFACFTAGTYLGYVAFAIPTGISSGIALAADMKLLMKDVLPEERTQVLASLYAVGYAGSAAFGFSAAAIADMMPLSSACWMAFLWLTLLCGYSLISRKLKAYGEAFEA